MRNIIIAGNWKMNKDAFETEQFCLDLGDYLKDHDEERVVPIIAPVFPFLAKAQSLLQGIPAAVAAQDVSAETAGAYTGEVSAVQLNSLGLSYCIIGHSERRQYHGESDALIREKLFRLRENDLIPIVCIGETLAQREAGQTEKVILTQLAGCFEEVELSSGREVVIAYEPVWAIGTGKTATSDQAQEVHALIREWLDKQFGQAIAANIHILYGGSVKPGNIRELLLQPDIDGGLIGGASLILEDFCAMIDTASQVIKIRGA
ncbi:MAG: triose-phosphate isomerase [Candidatus Syntrophosphaera sp.]|nr:triose-phosphate isomerase [Candidatus Syntrophosphaera sp.]